MRTRRGFVDLVDQTGNTVSVPAGAAKRIVKGKGWRYSDQPRKRSRKARTTSTPAGVDDANQKEVSSNDET